MCLRLRCGDLVQEPVAGLGDRPGSLVAPDALQAAQVCSREAIAREVNDPTSRDAACDQTADGPLDLHALSSAAWTTQDVETVRDDVAPQRLRRS